MESSLQVSAEGHTDVAPVGRRWSQLARGFTGAFRRLSPEPGITPFVILFVPRTGSNLLAGMLDSHSGILCHHELFLPGSPPHRSLSVRDGLVSIDLGTAEERDRDPFRFLRRVYSTHEGFKAVGFKMALSDVNVGVLLALTLNRSIRKIAVRRDNWLSVYTSALIAEQSEFIRFAAAEQSAPSTRSRRVNVDVDRFIRYARKRVVTFTLLRRLMRWTRQPWLEIEYEDIKRPESFGEVLRFLGVPPDSSIRERTVRQNPVGLEDRIENYAEVVERLRGTPYAKYLD